MMNHSNSSTTDAPSNNSSSTVAQNPSSVASDLNFDPAAVIDGGGEGQEGLDVST